MTRAISLFVAAFALWAQSDPTAEGLARFHAGDYRAAADSFRAALKTADQPLPRVYLALARAATGECAAVSDPLRREFDSAKGDLRRAAGLGYAQCAMSADNAASAYPVLEQLRAEFPGHPDVLYLAARFHMRAWNDVLYDLYQKAPASYRVNQISGEVFEMQGRLAEAEAEYRKAIGKNKAALNLHFRLGRVIALQSNSPESLAAAQAEFEIELTLNPGDAVAEYQVGQILVARQNPSAARARFQKALSIDPALAEALIALGKLDAAAGRHADAIGHLERAVKLRPNSEPALYNLMLAYRNAGRTADARAASDRLQKLQQPPQGEFTEFLKKLGEKMPPQ